MRKSLLLAFVLSSAAAVRIYGSFDEPTDRPLAAIVVSSKGDFKIHSNVVVGIHTDPNASWDSTARVLIQRVSESVTLIQIGNENQRDARTVAAAVAWISDELGKVDRQIVQLVPLPSPTQKDSAPWSYMLISAKVEPPKCCPPPTASDSRRIPEPTSISSEMRSSPAPQCSSVKAR